ncbi:MAG: hypothetical protein LM577_04475 [Thermoproteaceae archaeon]|nr:hypothetical protein [Thermoproteaceae archaeon]
MRVKGILFLAIAIMAIFTCYINLHGKIDGNLSARQAVIKFSLGTIYTAPDNSDNAYWLTCFNGSIYVHFNSQGDYYRGKCWYDSRGAKHCDYQYNVYEFNPETGTWRKVLERYMYDEAGRMYWSVGYEDVIVTVFRGGARGIDRPPLHYFLLQLSSDVYLGVRNKYSLDGATWRYWPDGLPYLSDMHIYGWPREWEVLALGVIGKSVWLKRGKLGEIDILEPSGWALDANLSKVLPPGVSIKPIFVGGGGARDPEVFILTNWVGWTPDGRYKWTYILVRRGPGNYSVKRYRAALAGDNCPYVGRSLGTLDFTFGIGAFSPHTYTVMLGGIEEVALLRDENGRIYFLSGSGTLKLALDLWGRPEWAQAYGYPGRGGLQRFIPAARLGDRVVFATSSYRGGSMGSELWSFDGIQLYRHAKLSFHIHSLAPCRNTLWASANMWQSIGDDPHVLTTSRALLVELDPGVLSRHELPPRFYWVWDGYTINSSGLYSDQEYFDGQFYYPASEILTAGYGRKVIYLVSNQSGTLRVEIDPDLRGSWLPHGEVLVMPNATVRYAVGEPCARMRFKFTPAGGRARVSAWVVLEP